MNENESKGNFMLNSDERKIWPQHCCVAAFVEAALLALGQTPPCRQDITRSLGVVLPNDGENPWHLPTSSDPYQWGVSVVRAKLLIPKLLQGFSKTLRFRHIPFDYVTMRLYDDLLGEALEKGCVVGVGFDFGHLHESNLVLRHICRVSRQIDCGVVLVDDSRGSDIPEKIVGWTDLEIAVRSVDDGYWIIGEQSAVDLSLASCDNI